MVEQSSLNRFFSEWFGIRGGREVFQADRKTRIFLDNPEQLQGYVQECRKRILPVYTSVQPYQSRNQVLGLEKLFFDFDCKENLEKAWGDAYTFASTLIKYYGVKPLVVFSGRKGFHVYVWLWTTVQVLGFREAFVKAVYEGMQRKLLKGLKFETLDPGVIGDIKRLARVPYSIHEKNGEICRPVNLSREPIGILDLEEYRKHGLGSKFLEKVCRETKTREKIKLNHHRNFEATGEVRPCIKAALNVPLNKGSGHLMRLAIATEYLNQGFSVPQVVDLFRSQPDFGNGEKSRYYVEDARKKRYKPFKCATIRRLGFCLGEKCPYSRQEGFENG